MLTVSSTSKNADDVVITLAIRTPLTKGFKGGFKDSEFDYLAYALLKKVIEKSRIDPQLVEDICCGNVSPSAPNGTGYLVPALTATRSTMAQLHTKFVQQHLPPASQTPQPLRPSTDSARPDSRLHKTLLTRFYLAASTLESLWAQN